MPFPEGDRLVLNEVAITELINGPDGIVARDLLRRGKNVETQAKLNATGIPVAGAINPGGRGPRVRTGRGRSSISTTIGRDTQGLYAAVGTNVFYMGILERGELPSGRKYPFLLPALPAAAI